MPAERRSGALGARRTRRAVRTVTYGRSKWRDPSDDEDVHVRS